MRSEAKPRCAGADFLPGPFGAPYRNRLAACTIVLVSHSVMPYILIMNSATENKGSKGSRGNRKGSFFVLDEKSGFTVGPQCYKRESAEFDCAYWAGRGLTVRVIDKAEYDALASEATKAGRRFC
jgi:hypothetical protein